MRNEHEYRGNDEVDLFELAKHVWSQKLLVCAVTLLTTVLAITYALLATPVYEAKLYFQAPSQNDVAQLNLGRGGESGLREVSVKDVYEIFLGALQSESVRYEFFRNTVLPSLNEEQRSGSELDNYERFRRSIFLSPVSRDAPTRYVLTVQQDDVKRAALWAEGYVDLVAGMAKQEVLNNARSDVSVKASNLEQQIYSAQKSAKNERDDLIARLEEALAIAKAIGLERPLMVSSSGSAAEVDLNGLPPYMRGAKALEAEVENLRKRPSDDPFIKDLREQQEGLRYYRGLNTNPDSIAVYRQDGDVEQVRKPIKPRKLLIVLLGGIVGLVLGGTIAVVRALTKRA